eukprot:Hpha_TRINITY_DN10794_c0_g2::TRINITY_DN10794_c0_g2_i1::g.43725::m.43725
MSAVLVLRWNKNVLEVLLQRRSSRIHHGNCWTFPGGALDPPEKEIVKSRESRWDEKVAAWRVTALREMVEEAGGGELGDLRPCDASSVGCSSSVTLPPGMAGLGRDGSGATAVKDDISNTMYFCYCIHYRHDGAYATNWKPRAIQACRGEVDEKHKLTVYGYRWDPVEYVIRNPSKPVKDSSAELVKWVKDVCGRQGDQLLHACQLVAGTKPYPLHIVPSSTREHRHHHDHRHYDAGGGRHHHAAGHDVETADTGKGGGKGAGKGA